MERASATISRIGPGALLMDVDGHPVVVISVDIVDDLVQTVLAVANPDKLRHLDPDSYPQPPSV
ncbi:MAG: hypothetical protein ACRDJ2_08225 [Actinomycetota bacterium]